MTTLLGSVLGLGHYRSVTLFWKMLVKAKTTLTTATSRHVSFPGGSGECSEKCSNPAASPSVTERSLSSYDLMNRGLWHLVLLGAITLDRICNHQVNLNPYHSFPVC
jgi:hypothetical protein